jgi:hypothetical protein
VIDDIFKFPQHRRHRLIAHLLRHSDTIGLDFAVGVIGADADKGAALPADQDEFNLAARVTAADFDAVGGGNPPRRDTVIDRRLGRPRNADRFEFGDMLVARDRIASGPAGDDGPIDRQCQRGGCALRIDSKCKIKHG